MADVKAVREPLFHVVKRSNIPVWKKLLYYAIAIVIALFLAALFCSASSDVGDIGDFFKYLFQGVVGTETRIWLFARDGMLLLGVALALLPAFKMRFWNLGANGQIVISCLVSYAVMLYLGVRGGVSNAVVIPVMIVAGVLSGVIWAVIPAIFKAFFNTNETLFTLMMNYIAQGLVVIMIKVWEPGGSGSLTPIPQNIGLIDIGNVYLLTIIVVAVLTVFSYFYLNKSKHGYELSVVGESVNTAKYAGMNVKKIVIRTMILSGLICGIIGVLLTGNINHSVHSTMHSNMGFTAIIATWLAGFNPLITIGTCFLITFISRGMSFVKIKFHFYDESIVNVVTGFIYFFIIACSFFISYKLIFKKKSKQPQVEKNDFMVANDEKAENIVEDIAGEEIEEKDNKTDEPVEEIIVVKEEDVKPVADEGVKEPQKPSAKKSAGKKATAKPAGAKAAIGKQYETKAAKKTVSKTTTSKSTIKAKKTAAAKTKPTNKGGNK